MAPMRQNFAEVVHARLDDRRLMLFSSRKGLWRAHEVIEVCQGLEGMEVLAQHRRQHLLGGGFARGAVTCTMGMSNLPRYQAASLPSAASVSSKRCRISRAAVLGHLGAQAAAAPF